MKSELGLPPHAYLDQVRIRRAKELLAAGGDPAEVAAEVGFCDQSHMGRVFKRTVGVSPARFVLPRSPSRTGRRGASGGGEPAATS